MIWAAVLTVYQKVAVMRPKPTGGIVEDEEDGRTSDHVRMVTSDLFIMQ